MRRLRGVAATARVLGDSRNNSLQDFSSVDASGNGDAQWQSESCASSSLESGSVNESLSSATSSLPSDTLDLSLDDEEEEKKARDLIRRWKETRTYLKIEKGELARSLLLLINVIAQIVLTVIAMEHQWDGTTLRDSNVALGLRITISVLAALLVLQMLEDNAWKIRKDAHDMRKRAKHAKEDRRQGRLHAAVFEIRRQMTPRRFYLPIGDETADYSFHTPTWMLVMEYLPFRFYLLFTIRVLLCLPHIAPFLNDEMTKLAAMLTFLKLFVVMSVLRHFNPIYRNRHLIARIPGSSRIEMPRFTTWFSTRTFYHQYPLIFSLVSIVAVVAVTAYGMYIYEREAQPKVFDFELCFVVAVENLITGWPGDVFGQYSLESDGGRTFSIFASLGGLFFFALLINFLYIKLSPSSNDSLVVDWIARLKLEDRERQEAAKLIQLVWHRRQERRRHAAEESAGGPFHLITVPAEKAYQVRFRRQCRELRHVRRELLELYGRTGDGLEMIHPHSSGDKKHSGKKGKSHKKEKKKDKREILKSKHGKHVAGEDSPYPTGPSRTQKNENGEERNSKRDSLRRSLRGERRPQPPPPPSPQLRQTRVDNDDSDDNALAALAGGGEVMTTDQELVVGSQPQQHEEEREEWERQRERMRKYYAKAVKNLSKLLAELDR